jgi:hypothetical protein
MWRRVREPPVRVLPTPVAAQTCALCGCGCGHLCVCVACAVLLSAALCAVVVRAPVTGSYAEPLQSDENSESWDAFLKDPHTDRLSANRQRQMNYDYAQNKFCPASALPGFVNHQSERNDAASLAGAFAWKYAARVRLVACGFTRVARKGECVLGGGGGGGRAACVWMPVRFACMHEHTRAPAAMRVRPMLAGFRRKIVRV